jgi:hypothetical protein
VGRCYHCLVLSRAAPTWLVNVKRSIIGRRFHPRFRDWLDTNQRESQDQDLLLAAFLATGGEALTTAAELVRKRHSPIDFTDKAGPTALLRNSSAYLTALRSLRTEGFAVLPWTLDTNMICRMRDHFEQGPARLISDDSSIHGETSPIDFTNPRAEKYEVPTVRVLESADVGALVRDPGLLSLAQDYLGAPPILDICTAWYSFPVERASSEAATMFHFDLDRVRWLKVFFYLNDVSRDNGAHLFIPRTHSDRGIPRKLLDSGYTRLEDDRVARFLPSRTWEEIEGPAGTILLEDTRGLHKGIPVISGYRAVLQFQYSVDLFGAPSSLQGVDYSGSVLQREGPERDRLFSALRGH